MPLMQIDLRPEIYDELNKEAVELGMTVEELCRFIIGSHINSRIAMKMPLMPSLQSIVGSSTPFDKLIKLSEMMLKQSVASGIFKCPHCTQPLDFESLERGECSACGNKL